MATEQKQPTDRRVTYKTYISLFPTTWDKLYAEARERGVSGRELLQAILTQWAGHQPTAAPMPTLKPKSNKLIDAIWTDEDETPQE